MTRAAAGGLKLLKEKKIWQSGSPSTASAASAATSCARIIETKRKDIEVVAINDLGPVETNAHLLRFDSVHGRFPGEVTVDGDSISLGNGNDQGHRRCATRPSCRWKDLGVDIAFECTGIFTAKDKASAHLTAGAKRVLVSAPGRRRRHDHRLRRQPRQADQGPPGRLQRLLHHQLPGAGRQGAERHCRHRDAAS